MANPYPAIFESPYGIFRRLDGEITFTDPSNQPGGGGGGTVDSVTAGDASITIGGTAADPTVAVSSLGITTAKIAAAAVTNGKIAASSVQASQMDSQTASANWVPLADGSGGVVWAASPGVNSLSAADASVVVGGTASAPTVRTGTLDTIATQHPPTAAVDVSSQKITNLADGTVSTDAAAYGQIPTSLPPSGSASGDLSGTYPGPTVAAIEGVAVSATAPTANQVLTASDATHAAWADNTAAGVSSLDSITGAVSLVAGSNITITDNSPSAGDITIAASGGGSSPLTTKGDLYGYDTGDARIPVGTNGQVLTADSTQALGVKWDAAGGGLAVTTPSQVQYATGSGSGSSFNVTLGSTPTVGNTLLAVIAGYPSALGVAVGFSPLNGIMLNPNTGINKSGAGSNWNEYPPWITANTNIGANEMVMVYAKAVVSGDGTTWEFANTANGLAVYLVELADVGSIRVLPAVALPTSSSPSPNIRFPLVSTPLSALVYLAMETDGTWSSTTPPTGYAQVADVSPSGGHESVLYNRSSTLAAGTTETPTASITTVSASSQPIPLVSIVVDGYVS